jgi:hypothetical protein
VLSQFEGGEKGCWKKLRTGMKKKTGTKKPKRLKRNKAGQRSRLKSRIFSIHFLN